jgi:hypothetical protein
MKLIITLLQKLLLLSICCINYGQKEWSRSYPYKVGTTVGYTLDEKFIIAGSVYDNMDMRWDVFQVDSAGNIEWQEQFEKGWPGRPEYILTTSDTGYLISGVNNNRAFFVNNCENYCLFGTCIEKNPNYLTGPAYSMVELSDSIYVTLGGNNNTVYLHKFKFYGDGNKTHGYSLLYDSIWQKEYNNKDYGPGKTILHSYDSGYYCLTENAFLIKTTGQGDTLWTKKIEPNMTAKAMVKTQDSSFVISGDDYMNSGMNTSKIIIKKISSEGNIVWTKEFIDKSKIDNINSSVYQTFDGGYITANYVEKTIEKYYLWIMKLNQYGDSVWSIKGTEPSGFPDRIFQTPDSMFILLTYDDYSKRPTLIKFDSTTDPSVLTNIKLRHEDKVNVSIIPNPVKHFIHIEIPKPCSVINVSLFNAKGYIVYHKNRLENPIRMSHLPHGMYFLKLMVDHELIVKKIIIE